MCAREIAFLAANLVRNFQVLSQAPGASECVLAGESERKREREREKEAELLKRAAGRETVD